MALDREKWKRVTAKCVIEARDGILLFFNQLCDVADGWYWCGDNLSVVVGPFLTRNAAINSAITASRQPVKVHVVDADNIHDDDPPFAPKETRINVFDTRGRVWVKTDEQPCVRTLKPLQ